MHDNHGLDQGFRVRPDVVHLPAPLAQPLPVVGGDVEVGVELVPGHGGVHAGVVLLAAAEEGHDAVPEDLFHLAFVCCCWVAVC